MKLRSRRSHSFLESKFLGFYRAWRKLLFKTCKAISTENGSVEIFFGIATVELGVSDFVYRIFGFSEIGLFRISHNCIMATWP